MYPPKMILNVDFALKLSNYTSWKRFYMSQMNLNKFVHISTIQFNHHTLPVTPFKPVPCFLIRFNRILITA